MNDYTGEQFGNYRLIKRLGTGGFADVYLGSHLHLERQAAIKILSTHVAPDDVERFRAEARTISRLEHPHIVPILDFGIERGIPFLIMAYAPNGTLRQHILPGQTLPPMSVGSYIAQLASALQYAHTRKIIHRDVKPENMLVGQHGEVLLSDFGIALVLQSINYQSLKEISGTAPYMAPEQLQGKPCPASDQYALAVIAYEWLCGTRPFEGSREEIYAQHLFAAPPPLHEKKPDISPAITSVVLTALAKDPQQRFPTIEAFSTALQHAIQPQSYVLPIPLSTGPAQLANSMQPYLSSGNSALSDPTHYSSYPQHHRPKRTSLFLLLLAGCLVLLPLMLYLVLTQKTLSAQDAHVTNTPTITSISSPLSSFTPTPTPTTTSPDGCPVTFHSAQTLYLYAQGSEGNMSFIHALPSFHRQTLLAPSYSADTVKIYDGANVLTPACIEAEAASLPYSVVIYTTNSFSGTTTAFQQETASKVTNAYMLVIAIDTTHHYIWMAGKPTTSSQLNTATDAFSNAFRTSGGNYTQATIALIRSLKQQPG